MRKIFILLIAAFAAFSCNSAPFDYTPWYKSIGGGSGEGGGGVLDEDGAIRIMSFNVRNSGLDTGTENAWNLRRPGVYAMIKDKWPVTLGLQEVVTSQLNDILTNCPQYQSYGVGRDDGVNSGERTAILYLTDSVSVVEYGTFWLSPTPNTPSTGWGATIKRTCTWIHFKMKSSGDEFYHFNTHLDHQSAEAQIEGVKLILARMEEINAKGLPVVLTGDFNVEQNSAALVNIPLGNARKDAPKTDNYPTNPGFGGTANKQFDHIFYKNCTAVSYETIRDRWEGITLISDHYPIMAKFRFTD